MKKRVGKRLREGSERTAGVGDGGQGLAVWTEGESGWGKERDRQRRREGQKE